MGGEAALDRLGEGGGIGGDRGGEPAGEDAEGVAERALEAERVGGDGVAGALGEQAEDELFD